MSKRNKEKRAAKQKARARHGSRPETGHTRDGAHAREGGGADDSWWRAQAAPPIELVTGLIWKAAFAQSWGDVAPARNTVRELTAGHYARRERLVYSAADLLLRQAMTQLWANGWQPYDVYQITTRQLGALEVTLVVDAIIGEIGQRAPTTVHRRWRDQLEAIGGQCWWQPDRPQLGQWARRHGRSAAEALMLAIAVLARLIAQPVLPEIPLPREQETRSGVD
ncbi:MAG: hypothetical protein ACRDRL_12275, partial [Sciscionella sp.]